MKTKPLRTMLVIAVTMSLYGCGGGSSPLVAAVPMSITGTAATGFAISDAAVSVSCVVGTGTASTSTNGSYSATVAGGVGPCLVTVTKPATDTSLAIQLQSIVSGTGASQVSNVTPLTHALVQYLQKLTGVSSPAALLTDLAAKALLSDKTALTQRINDDFLPFVLATLGVDIKSADFLETTIVPATATTLGSQSDQDLEAFKTVTQSNGELTDNALALIHAKADADKVAHPVPFSTPVAPSVPRQISSSGALASLAGISSLVYPAGFAVSVVNSSTTDGVVVVSASNASTGTTIETTVSTSLDASIFSKASFTSVTGVSILTN